MSLLIFRLKLSDMIYFRLIHHKTLALPVSNKLKILMKLVPNISFLFVILISSQSAKAEGHRWPPFKLGLSYLGVSNSIEIKPLEPLNPSPNLELRPAKSNYAGIIIGFKWLSGVLSFAVPAEKKDREIEGTSLYNDLRVNYLTKRFGLELSYNYYKRFILDNSNLLSQATLNGDRFYVYPDMQTVGYGLNGIYVFKPDQVSLPAALEQSDHQSTSGGSWIGIATIRRQFASSSKPFVPDELQSNFSSDATVNDMHLFQTAIGGGYLQNWVEDRFFLSLMGGFSFGFQELHYRSQIQNFERIRGGAIANAHTRLGFGWNADHFFFYLNAYMDRYQMKTETLDAGSLIFGTGIAIGVRI